MADFNVHGVKHISIQMEHSFDDIGKRGWVEITIHSKEGPNTVTLFADDISILDIFNRHITTTDEEADKMETAT